MKIVLDYGLLSYALCDRKEYHEEQEKAIEIIRHFSAQADETCIPSFHLKLIRLNYDEFTKVKAMNEIFALQKRRANFDSENELTKINAQIESLNYHYNYTNQNQINIAEEIREETGLRMNFLPSPYPLPIHFVAINGINRLLKPSTPDFIEVQPEEKSIIRHFRQKWFQSPEIWNADVATLFLATFRGADLWLLMNAGKRYERLKIILNSPEFATFLSRTGLEKIKIKNYGE
ncbi:hypothetical protein BH09BAC5_BH09BAC5_19080 [soil metagenome]